jgi:hypothetical protein
MKIVQLGMKMYGTLSEPDYKVTSIQKASLTTPFTQSLKVLLLPYKTLLAGTLLDPINS